MKRGRATFDHPERLVLPDGRVLISHHAVALLTQTPVYTVRRRVPAVACDKKTRVLLVDLDDAERVLAGTPARTR